ncbi:hypothetical protein BJ138DRAFT_1170370 [Hygrophoropsis aurantiaca]|uniref:Uncharacterized protein n=1 Tax=Hygrophoropsis aurantiaca TaxID=72124 RepID=A0ACB8AQ89_9AGAM|nr:hypothetical protein BJ138DRAFT_1170370 [Hygrophoropsis aurantiaca]
MAKPKYGKAESSHTTPSLLHRPQQRTSKTKSHHKRSYARSAAAAVCPSSSLLSILATIAANSPTVDGSPLPVQTAPPTFLCPLIARDNIETLTESPVTIPPNAGIQQIPDPSPTPKLKKRRQIADKYVQGNDSRWRKTDAWTLYGSSCCSITSSIGINDAQAGPTASTSSSSLYPSSTSAQGNILEDTSVLPAGWPTGSTSSSQTDSTIILALAIVLAVSICSFMIGCIFWRRKKKRVKVEQDIELKVRQKVRPDDASEDGEREKEARGKLKIWSKASARWKASVRQSARRRRPRRHVVSASRASRSRSPSLSDIREISSFSTISPPRSPRVSFTSHPDPIPSLPLPVSPVLEMEGTLTPIAEHHTSRVSPISPPSSPPAYNPSLSSRQASTGSDRDSFRSTQRMFDRNNASSHEDDVMPYVPCFVAHIATDDKTQLARLEDLASAPPSINVDGASSSVQPLVSAPVWLDEPEDYTEDLPPHADVFLSPVHGHMLSSFPPPPSKVDTISNCFAKASSYGDDFETLEPENEPSAPPFDEPNDSILEAPALAPSAPPLEEDTSHLDNWHDGEELTGQSSRLTSPGSYLTSPLISVPPVQGPVAQDGTLPQYHP